MKILTLNGDWAIATTAFAQFYESFAWDNPNALTAFDFGIEQAFFDSLEEQFGAHKRISEHKVEWRDGTDTITLITDANLSVDLSQREKQIANLSAQNDTLHLTYSSAEQANVDLTWSATSLQLTSGTQSATFTHSGPITFLDLSDITRAIATFGTFAEGFEDEQVHAINASLDLSLGPLRFMDQTETSVMFQVADGSIALSSRGYTITLWGDFTADDAAMLISDLTVNFEDITGLSTLIENEQIERITIQDASENIVLQAMLDPENKEESGISLVTLLGGADADVREIETQFLNDLYASSFVADLGDGDDELTYNAYGQFDQVSFDYVYDSDNKIWADVLAEDQDIQIPQSNINGASGHDRLYIEHAYTTDQSYTPLNYRGPVNVNFTTGTVIGYGVYTDQTQFEIFRVSFENVEQVKTDWVGDLTVLGSTEDDDFALAFIPELGSDTLSFDAGSGQDTLDISQVIDASDDQSTLSAWTHGIRASDWKKYNWRWSKDGDWTVISMETNELFRLKSVEKIRFSDTEISLADYLNVIPSISAHVYTNGDDSIEGDAGNDEIFALDGDNFIESSGGDDTVEAGFGDDLINTGSGSDQIRAGGGDDTISAGDGDDWIDAAGGHDLINADQGDDTITGGNGFDTIRGGMGSDHLSGGAHSDDIAGDEGDDTLLGGLGRDTLTGGAGSDILGGGDGDDQLSDADGGGTLSGDAGNDTIQLFDTLISDTIVTGGMGEDVLELRHLDYKSSYDKDSIYWDIIKTDTGYSLNIGAAHNDIAQTISISELEQIKFSQDDIDSIENVHLWMNTKRGDVYRLGFLDQDAVETINMGNRDTYAEIKHGTITLNGSTGNDTVRVGSQNDPDGDPNATLNLGAGNNTVTVYAGQAKITTGAGSDNIKVLHDQAQIHAFTGQGNDHVETLAGDDVVHTGAGNDTVSTGAGSDIITNISGNDQIYSGHGQDRVTSYSGNTLVDDRGDAKDQNIAVLDDIIITGFGDDTVHAGAGQDVVVTDLPGSIYYGSDHLIGMTGDDILFGGRGADTFVFRAGDGNDTIGAIDMDAVSSAKEIKDIEFIAPDFMSGVDTVRLQFDTHFVGAQLSDVIAENTDWFWLETEGGITLSTSDGSLHFWGLTGNQVSDTDFEFIG